MIQFPLFLLSHPDRIPNHLSVFQASREPSDMAHKSIIEPIIHKDVGHAGGDNVEKDLALNVE